MGEHRAPTSTTCCAIFGTRCMSAVLLGLASNIDFCRGDMAYGMWAFMGHFVGACACTNSPLCVIEVMHLYVCVVPFLTNMIMLLLIVPMAHAPPAPTHFMCAHCCCKRRLEQAATECVECGSSRS